MKGPRVPKSDLQIVPVGGFGNGENLCVRDEKHPPRGVDGGPGGDPDGRFAHRLDLQSGNDAGTVATDQVTVESLREIVRLQGEICGRDDRSFDELRSKR